VRHGRHRRLSLFRFIAPRVLAAAGALSTSVSLSPGALAEPVRSFELTWRAPSGCPTSAEVEREITRLIGDSSRNRATVRASAEVTRSGEDWRVQIRIHDGDYTSERSFDGASCRAVTKVASLIIALAIEPNAGAAAEVTPPLPPEKPEGPTVAVASRPAAEAPRRGFLAAGPVVELRLLPHVGFGFELGGGIRWPSLSLELRAGALLPQDAGVAATDAGGRFFQVSAGARACARIVSRGPEIFACATGLLDVVTAEGYGVTAPGTATALLGTAALGPRVDFWLGEPWRLSLSADATHTFTEATFLLDNVGSVHQTPRWGGAARVQLIWFF
jgi:hypothetical protein